MWFSVTGQVFSDSAGSLYYAAPEILLNENYGPEADIWSAGVILFVLLSGGMLPFEAGTVTMICCCCYSVKIIPQQEQ